MIDDQDLGHCWLRTMVFFTSLDLKVAMPRYFFDTDDGDQPLRDDEGTEFAGLQEACDEAVRILPDIARDVLPPHGMRPQGNQRAVVVVVRDENNQAVFTATLSLKTEWLVLRPVDGMPGTPPTKP
jgi:hypothetical protein